MPAEATKKVNSSPKNKKESNSSLQGRWTNEEHKLFVEGIRLFKRDWRSIENHIGTRTCSQIRSHAQKYYMRLERQQSGSSPHSAEEDDYLMAEVLGPKKASKVAQSLHQKLPSV